jgi:hypothetical protein
VDLVGNDKSDPTLPLVFQELCNFEQMPNNALAASLVLKSRDYTHDLASDFGSEKQRTTAAEYQPFTPFVVWESAGK